MSENEGKQNPRKRSMFRVITFSRRQFLKHAAVAAAGVAIASLPAACKSPGSTVETTTETTTTETTATTSTSPTSSAPVSTAPTSSAPVSTSTTPVTSTVTTSNPPASGYNYIPSTAAPPLKPVPGTDCVVATDKAYSQDHIWVLSLPNNVVALGISSTMVELLTEPHKISLSPVGTILSKGDTFGSIEGFKMASDLLTPVSGTIIETDAWVLAQSSEQGVIAQINDDPYRSGWLIVVQLRIPSELSGLLTAQQYINLLAK
jgi:glycine cleavage system H protein